MANSEQDKHGSEGQAPAIDLTKYVPKEELEKAQSASKAETEKLRAELEQAKMSLLDPEYIAHLESRKGRESQPVRDASAGEIDIDSLTPKQLLQVAINQAVQATEERSAKRFSKIESALSDTLALLELRDVESKYKDFADYRNDVAKILEDPKSNLTIEQAYKLVKADRLSQKEADTKEETPTRRAVTSEKPSNTVPAENMQRRSFKSSRDAADDAWDQVVGSGKDNL